MRVGIIGAGLAGLVAGRTLTAAGHEVVVVEKSRGVGGRLATRRVADTVVDHGAPVLSASPGGALAGLLGQFADLDRVDLAEGVAFRSGATAFPKRLAEGLAIVRGARVAALRRSAAGFELADEQGNTHGLVDRVIVTAPAPQAADLLAASGVDDARVGALRAVTYEPAIMILAGYRVAAPDGLHPFPVGDSFALVANESAKGRTPVDGVVPIVARLNPTMSADLLDAADTEILARMLPALTAALGAPADPEWVQVKRWRYAIPVGAAEQRVANAASDGIVLAGDSVAIGFDAVVTSALAAVHQTLR